LCQCVGKESLENANEEVVGLPHRIMNFLFLQKVKSSNLANKNKETVGVALSGLLHDSAKH
jgi:hypothetical protein